MNFSAHRTEKRGPTGAILSKANNLRERDTNVSVVVVVAGVDLFVRQNDKKCACKFSISLTTALARRTPVVAIYGHIKCDAAASRGQLYLEVR